MSRWSLLSEQVWYHKISLQHHICSATLWVSTRIYAVLSTSLLTILFFIFVLLFRKRDVTAGVQQRRKEDHQVRAGRLHIVPPASSNPPALVPTPTSFYSHLTVCSYYPSIDTKQAQPQWSLNNQCCLKNSIYFSLILSFIFFLFSSKSICQST